MTSVSNNHSSLFVLQVLSIDHSRLFIATKITSDGPIINPTRRKIVSLKPPKNTGLFFFCRNFIKLLDIFSLLSLSYRAKYLLRYTVHLKKDQDSIGADLSLVRTLRSLTPAKMFSPCLSTSPSVGLAG